MNLRKPGTLQLGQSHATSEAPIATGASRTPAQLYRQGRLWWGQGEGRDQGRHSQSWVTVHFLATSDGIPQHETGLVSLWRRICCGVTIGLSHGE